jgi:formamidopyrimidine-DNA glycosylase
VPELPEVEVIRRRIIPCVAGQTVTRVIVRNAAMRWPVAAEITTKLPGQTIQAIERRGKYLLFRCPDGNLILHLGMTGFLHANNVAIAPGKHDHLDILLSNSWYLRFNDYRRFGLVLWTEGDPLQHPLLADLGLEPFDETFNGAYLYRRSRGRKAPVRQFLLDQRIVAGIGNIYANEALFAARIHPARPAGRISQSRYGLLAKAIQAVLGSAIERGGTLLDSSAGSEYFEHFRLELLVYGRAGQPCPNCGTLIERGRHSQRSYYSCRNCQR